MREKLGKGVVVMTALVVLPLVRDPAPSPLLHQTHSRTAHLADTHAKHQRTSGSLEPQRGS